MENKSNTRITVDIPTIDHKRLKVLAALHGKSMRAIFIDLIERGLESYEECPYEHEPNETTKKALENAKKRKGLHKASSVKDLFEQLSKE